MAHAVHPPALRHPRYRPFLWFYAGILVALTVSQLVLFTDTIGYVRIILGDTADTTAAIIGVTLTGVQIFSLPYLLRVHVSKLAYRASALMLVIVPLLWLTLGAYGILLHTDVPGGFRAALVGVVMLLLSAATFWISCAKRPVF